MVSRRIRKITKRKIKKSRKYKQRNSIRRKSSRRNRISKRIIGGKHIQDGHAEALYADPRPPCVGVDETIESVSSLNELGKIFEDTRISYADAEMNSIIVLKDIPNASNYFVLPIKKCNINRALLESPPYNTPKWKQNTDEWKQNTDEWKQNTYEWKQNTDEWKQNKDENYSQRIFKNAEDKLPEDWNTMVVYPLGQKDLLTVLSDGLNSEQFIIYLNSLTNILEGMRLLQEQHIFYGDLKAENIIVFPENILKIGDIGDFRKISPTMDMKTLPYFYQYFIHPSIAAYMYWFIPHKDSKGDYIAKDINDIQLNAQFLLKLYNFGTTDLNNENISILLNQNFLSPFTIITEDMGFSLDQIDRVTAIGDSLLEQKLFDYTGFLNTWSDPSKFTHALSVNDTHVNKYLSIYKLLFQTYPNLEELKIDLLRRIDTYSIGILILNCIGAYIKQEQIFFHDLIIELYYLVGKCCNQMTERCANIDDIMRNFREIVQNMKEAQSMGHASVETQKSIRPEKRNFSEVEVYENSPPPNKKMTP